VRVLIQRVNRGEVRVEGKIVGSIGEGLLVLVGIGHGDTPETARDMADKVVGLRIFRDQDGRTNRSLTDVGGALLAVSQFTLYADTSRGRRPGFTAAADPAVAIERFETFASAVAAAGVHVERGVFGSEMEVELVNDGPMTIWLESPAPSA
jgi:D-tyrosyl-tRNA(Tyr) deacylase